MKQPSASGFRLAYEQVRASPLPVHVDVWADRVGGTFADCSRVRVANRRFGSAGKLPVSVRTRYDFLGTYIRERLQ